MAKKKTEGGVEYPASAYLYVPDKDKPSTWKLRYKNYADGNLEIDQEQLGKAVAAFSPGGYRGNQVELPDEDRKKVLAKIKSIYRDLGVDEEEWPETIRGSQDVSLDEIRDILWQAVNEKDTEAYLMQVYPGYLIYEKAGKYYKLGWGMVEGEVKLGSEAVEVEKVWVEARSSQGETDEEMEVLMRLDGQKDPEGAEWEVTICEPGFSKHHPPWYLAEDVLREAADLFEGVDVNLYELPEATHVPDTLFDIKRLLAKNKVGWIDNVRYVAGEGLKGVLHFLDSAKWLGRNLVEGIKKAVPIYGLSYDCPVRAKKDVIDGQLALVVKKFLAADSVDIVTRPAAGGKFIRAVASRQAQTQKRRRIMDREQLLALIKEKRPDLLEGKELDSITDEEVIGLARMAMEPSAQGQGGAGDPSGGGGGEPAYATKEELDLWRCEMSLSNKLEASDLPEPARERIRAVFGGKVFKAEDLDKAIADEKDYLAKMAQSAGREEGMVIASTRITGGLRSFEKIQMACDRMFGLSQEDMKFAVGHRTLENKPFFEDLEARSKQDYEEYDDVPAFSSIREMYTLLTGDPDVSGRFNRRKLPAELRAMADITSATFSYVLGNTLGRRLVRSYRKMDFKEDLLISIRKTVKDFRQQEAVLVGGFPDIATVDPEAADYQEIASVSDEESTYTVGAKGNLLTITRKTIINDDISLIQRLVDGFARAFARTHGKYVWNFFINNSNCTDGTAWFTSSHGNLGSSALSHSTAYTAWKFLAKTTEKDSGERIGLIDGSFKLNLVGPPDIKNLMSRIAHEEFYYSSDDLTTKLPNPLYEEVEDHVIALLTDTDDWGLLLPPDVIDTIEIGYLNGREEPEFFVADSPQSEQVFVADKIRHKGRHEYAGAVIDYRSGYKAEV